MCIVHPPPKKMRNIVNYILQITKDIHSGELERKPVEKEKSINIIEERKIYVKCDEKL